MMGLAALVGIVVWMSFDLPQEGEEQRQITLNTQGEYINVVDWPPQAQMIDQQFSCTEAGVAVERAGETRRKMINGREYCVTKIIEGAAGSTYTQYAYATGINGKTLIFTFSTRASQCANYEPEESIACEAEQKAFDPDPFIDDLVKKQEVVGTQNLSEPTARGTTISGTYICLPHTDTSGPQTLECALGLRATDGSYYALDFSQSQNAQFDLKTGDRFSAEGILTPVDDLDSGPWEKYPIKGVFKITGEIERF